MRSPRPRRMLVHLATALLLPVSIAVAGCEPQQVGTAAVIKGDPLTIEELQASTRDFLAVVPAFDENEAQRQILNSMIFSEVLRAAGQRLDVAVSDAEAAALRDGALEEFGGRKKLVRSLAQQRQVLPPGYLEQAARDISIRNKIVEKVAAGRDPSSPQVGQDFSQVLSSAARSLDIDVNPRYGTWDPQGVVVTPLVGGGLSKSLTEFKRGAERK